MLNVQQIFDHFQIKSRHRISIPAQVFRLFRTASIRATRSHFVLFKNSFESLVTKYCVNFWHQKSREISASIFKRAKWWWNVVCELVELGCAWIRQPRHNWAQLRVVIRGPKLSSVIARLPYPSAFVKLYLMVVDPHPVRA